MFIMNSPSQQQPSALCLQYEPTTTQQSSSLSFVPVSAQQQAAAVASRQAGAAVEYNPHHLPYNPLPPQQQQQQHLYSYNQLPYNAYQYQQQQQQQQQQLFLFKQQQQQQQQQLYHQHQHHHHQQHHHQHHTQPRSSHSHHAHAAAATQQLKQQQQQEKEPIITPTEAFVASLVQELSFWEPQQQQQNLNAHNAVILTNHLLAATTAAMGTTSAAAAQQSTMPRSKFMSRSDWEQEDDDEEENDDAYDEGDENNHHNYHHDNRTKEGRGGTESPVNDHHLDGGEKRDVLSNNNTILTPEEEFAALEAAAAVWKSALDPVTNRIYYYDTLTRKTQWEKPDAIRALEKRKRADKRRQDELFFRGMEQNIIDSLQRGELIPGISRQDTTKQGPPLEPIVNTNYNSSKGGVLNSTQQQKGANASNPRVRTISGMNEQLLVQLQQHADGHNHGPLFALTGSTQPQQAAPPSRPSALTNASRTSSGGAAPPNKARPPLARRLTSTTTSATKGVSSTCNLNTIHSLPAPSAANTTGNSLATQTSYHSSDSLELSPDTTGRPATTTAESPLATLRGEALLEGATPGPVMIETDDDRSTISAADVAAGNNKTDPFSLMTSNSNDSAKSTTTPPSTTLSAAAAEAPVNPTSHIRRNTGGTIYVQSTMENPDVHAMIKCVCGVYRAHIIQSVARRQQMQQQHRTPVSVNTALVNLDIFRDDYETPPVRQTSIHYLQHQHHHVDPPIPPLADIELFYHDFYVRSQMEHDTIIMSLIYVERLIKETNGVLTPDCHNWRSVLFSCMVLSSKVWDDLSMFNLDFSNVSMASAATAKSGLSAFSLKRTNALELAVLTSLNFNVRIPASEYAKYYFLIRAMLARSGLLQEAAAAQAQAAQAKQQAAAAAPGSILESRTDQYQQFVIQQLQQTTTTTTTTTTAAQQIKGGNERRTRSVDWSFFGTAAAGGASNNNETLCLEQLVSMGTSTSS